MDQECKNLHSSAYVAIFDSQSDMDQLLAFYKPGKRFMDIFEMHNLRDISDFGFDEYMYSGFNEMDVKGKFIWSGNGVEVTASMDLYWRHGEPSHDESCPDPIKEERCAVVRRRTTIELIDVCCDRDFAFVCQVAPV